MTYKCQCNVCKYSRGEISREVYKSSLKKDIGRYKNILADKNSSEIDKESAEWNKDGAGCLLYELEQKESYV